MPVAENWLERYMMLGLNNHGQNSNFKNMLHDCHCDFGHYGLLDSFYI